MNPDPETGAGARPPHNYLVPDASTGRQCPGGQHPDRQHPDVTVDAVGLRCPMPVIQLGRAAAALGAGLIEVIADDPTTRTDIPAWCRMRSAELLEESETATENGDRLRYLIRVGDWAQNAGGVATT